MPGDTPEEAVRAFLAPFQEGLRAFQGVGKIVCRHRGAYRKGVSYQWTLNDEDGMRLTSVGTFYASMRFEVVDSNPADHDEENQGTFRCSARGYNYKLATPRGADLWRMHWHPVGVSPAKGPHVHLPPDLDRHLPTGRMTFENALMWLIEFDAPLRMSRDEAVAHLAELEAPHVLYRTWSTSPPEHLLGPAK